MHLVFVLPCNCLSSRKLSGVKIVCDYFSASVTAAKTDTNETAYGFFFQHEIDTNHSWPTWAWRSWSRSRFQCASPWAALCHRGVSPERRTELLHIWKTKVNASCYWVIANAKVDANMASVVFPYTHLAGLEEVKADVGVTCGWIHAVLTEVLTDVFWRGLGQ